MKKNKVAIFDVDGTIFRRNLHFELLSELVYLKIFKKEVKSKLVEIYGRWLNNEGTYEAYRDNLVRLYEENIKRKNQRDITKAARIVAHFNRKRIYLFTKGLIEKMRDDHVMVIISGSPIEIVGEYSKMLGFDEHYGSVYEVDKNGNYTGSAIFEPTVDKGAVIKQFVAENNLTLKDSFGIGDTETDSKFLELVDMPIAFNPSSGLKLAAEKNDWKTVVEKKDVIHQIAK